MQEIDCIDDVRVDTTRDSKATSRLPIRSCYPSSGTEEQREKMVLAQKSRPYSESWGHSEACLLETGTIKGGAI